MQIKQFSSTQRFFSWFLLIVANIMWSTSYVVAKIALREVTVPLMLALRMVISALVLLPLLLIERKKFSLTRKDILQLVILTLTGFIINNLLQYTGLAISTASDVALLISCESIFTALLSWVLLHERFKNLTVFALLLGLGGAYLVVERGFVPNLPAGGGALRIWGDLLVILALFFESFYTVRCKSMLVKHRPLLITSATIVSSAIFWTPVAGWLMLTTNWHLLSWVAWMSIGWIAIMSTVVAYLSWFQGLVRIDGTAAASTLFLQPLLGTLFAVVLLQDQLTIATIIGGALIMIAVYLLSRF